MANPATHPSKEAQTRAEANFKKKEVQLREGAKAMAEYVAAGVAEREKTVRLRLQREAKEAREAAAAADAAAARDTAPAQKAKGKAAGKKAAR